MRIMTMERLMQRRIFIHRGGFSDDPAVTIMRENPIMAVWQDSEDPTEAEIKLLADILRAHVKNFYPDAKNGRAKGANTVTLKKENGLWTFRHRTWSQGPQWHPQPGSLEEIRKKL